MRGYKTTRILCIVIPTVIVFASCKNAQNFIDSSESKMSQRDHKSTEKDSINVYIKDSVFILIKGDTVYISKWRTQYMDRLIERSDTLRISDTIKLKSTLTKTVKLPLNSWQNFQIWCGRIVLIVLGICFIIVIIKQKVKKIKS